MGLTTHAVDCPMPHVMRGYQGGTQSCGFVLDPDEEPCISWAGPWADAPEHSRRAQCFLLSCRDIPFSIVYFPLFANLNNLGFEELAGKASFAHSFMSGCAAGSIAAVTVTPLDGKFIRYAGITRGDSLYKLGTFIAIYSRFAVSGWRRNSPNLKTQKPREGGAKGPSLYFVFSLYLSMINPLTS